MKDWIYYVLDRKILNGLDDFINSDGDIMPK